jgi:UDP-N-acetylmuramoylalanine-D-glutamate ligase
MPPRICWSDLAGRQVGVWGAGVEGRAAIRKLRSLGVTPAAVVDDAPGLLEAEGLPVLASEPEGIAALAACAVVVKSPGISPLHPAAQALVEQGVLLVGGLGLWLEEADRERVVCVTGTKGKSTTVSIIGALAEGLGYRCFVGGNLGSPPYDPQVAAGADLWVIEVSSYQAADCTCSPPVVAVTSLHPDHLIWHGSLEAYYGDKLSLCRLPGARLTVANGTDATLRAHEGLLGPKIDWVQPPSPVPAWVAALGLLGRHNEVNALVAQHCLAALAVPGAKDPAALAAAAVGFRRLASRLRPVGTVGGVTFVDDSLSTNVLSTTAALEAFAQQQVALLVGGFDRGIDYHPLAAPLAGRVPATLVLTLPDNGARIARELREERLPERVALRVCADLEEAVRAGYNWAGPGGVVLLSPAAPSFGRYADYRQRAEHFVAAARACGPLIP